MIPSQVMRIVQLKPSMDIMPKFRLNALMSCAALTRPIAVATHLQDRLLPQTRQVRIIALFLVPGDLLAGGRQILEFVRGHGGQWT
jgi:hypothetical protein